MNTRYLLAALMVFVLAGLAITSRSTLTPAPAGNGVDHVFYADYSDFMAQEAATGDFNGDGNDDIVTTLMWDDPTTCGATPGYFDQTWACDHSYTRWIAQKASEDTTICGFPNPILAQAQKDYWEACGWTIVDTLSCGECWEAKWFSENKGAAYIFKGGDWSSKPRDINLATGSGADHIVVGNAGGDKIYNGIGVGDITIDQYDCDELVLGASQQNRDGPSYGPGEVYVIGGDTPSEPWPAAGTSAISPPDDDLVDFYFKGRDENDAFGMGIAVGDLDGDQNDDIVVAAPFGDGPNNNLPNAGEIYIFYNNDSLRTEVDLSTMTDSDFESGDASAYAQVIWGAAAGDETGVTLLEECHDAYPGHAKHCTGNYEPVGLAIGDWNGDGFNDLAIGAGAARGDDGAVYVIFGAPSSDPTRKLRPGKTLKLYRALGDPAAPDVKIVGKDDSHLGAGIALVDADGEGPSGKDDLVLGAPYADLGGQASEWEYYGEVYIMWGDDSPPDDSLYVGNSSHVDVTIHGQNIDDQIGGHFAGNRDIDGDEINDLGIAGQEASFLLFGREQNDWESTIDLETDLSTNRGLRVLKWTSDPVPNSMTIEFLNLDGEDGHDLVFGGYDNPGYPGNANGIQHAGQMWVTRGWDMWKKGTVSANATWSGITFVDGDITVASGVTLTIAPGSHIWVWQQDAERDGVDTTRVEINVQGTLVADGTAADPIVFESWDWETQTNEDWVGFYFDDESGGGTFDNCIIRRAEYAIESYVNLTVKNSTFEDCRYSCITGHDGTALVQGCTMTDPGTWGIFLTAADATIRNTTVANAVSAGLHVQPNASAEVRNSQFLDSDNGLFVNGGAVVNIDSTCTFSSNVAGVYCYNTGTTPVIKNSTLDSNTGSGVLCDNSSDPLIQGNTMRYNAYAVYCTNDASPTIKSNTITSNTNGVWASSGGNPDIGHYSSTGNNTIAFSTAYHAVNFNEDALYAQNNCWDDNSAPCDPKASKLYGEVDTSNPICCDVSPSSPSEPLPEPEAAPPIETALIAVVPNPFNPVTAVHYSLARQSAVKIVVYDVAGRFVRELVNGTVASGVHRAVWEGVDARGTPVASGVYFVKMSAGSFTRTMKMVLLK